MIAAVLVKSVPVAAGALRVAGDRLSREGLPHGLDPVNALAVEWALQHRDAGAVTEVVALTMGPSGARDALQAAVALGCDRGVHVVDDRLAGADLRRTVAILAQAVRQLEADLALCGYESSDGSSGAVPAALAAALGWSLVTRALEAALDGDVVRAMRDAGPAKQLLEAPVPAVVSFVEGELIPRHATLKATIAARRKPVAALDAEALGGLPDADGPAERVVALRAVEAPQRDPLVLDAASGAEHLRALAAELSAR